jgi:hydroxymethylglutaryl-CoA reductase
MKILEHKNDLIRIANEQDPTLVNLGGGAKDIEVRVIDTAKGPMVITHLIVDVRDAMGANAVNTMAEAVAPYIEDLTNGKVFLRIITNLADKRLVRARTVIDKNEIGGEEVVDGIVEAWAFAAADPYRATTHNKGIMNGIIAVALATAQDHRALEAGAHAYAARFGHYTSLSTWEKNENGDLVGTLEMPMAVGLVGGAVKTHPIARIAIKILGIKTANELGEIMAAVGLIQNLAALKALVTEGIQKGHMKLHARNIAIMAGATPDILDKVVEIMINEGKIRFDRAKEIVEQLKKH